MRLFQTYQQIGILLLTLLLFVIPVYAEKQAEETSLPVKKYVEFKLSGSYSDNNTLRSARLQNAPASGEDTITKEEIEKQLQQIGENVLDNSTVLLVNEHTDKNSDKISFRPRGSGFFVRKDLIVTNVHVVAGAPPPLFAKFVSTETMFPIEGVAAFDVKNDLVILKVAGEGIPLPLCNSDKVQIGETVCAVGYPGGKKGTVTQITIQGIRDSDKLFRIKEGLQGGHSGSVVLNSRGEIIGVAVASGVAFAPEGSPFHSGDSIVHSFAIPSNILSSLLISVEEMEPIVEWQNRPLILAYAKGVEGQQKMLEGKYKKAIVCFDAALKLNPDLADLYFNRGNVKVSLGQLKKAIADFDAALKLNPDNIAAYMNRGIAKVTVGQYKGAIADFGTALELKPDYVNAYVYRATVRLVLRQPEKALADLDNALKLNPDSIEANWCCAWVKRDLVGDYAAAIGNYDKIISLSSNKNITAYNERGEAKSLLGKSKTEQGRIAEARDLYQAAIADYTEIINLKLQKAKTYKSRGWTKYLLGQLEAEQENEVEAQRLYQEAVADIDEGLRLKPKGNKFLSAFYHNLAVTKAALGDHEAAITDFNDAIQLHPKKALYYYGRGLSKETLGQHEAAEADFAKAKEINPNLKISHSN